MPDLPEPKLGRILKIAVPIVVSRASYTVMLFINRLFLSRVGKYELAAAMSGGLSSLVPSSFPCSPGYRVCIDAARGLHLCCCESHLVGGGYRAMDGRSVARSLREPECLPLRTIFGTLKPIGKTQILVQGPAGHQWLPIPRLWNRLVHRPQPIQPLALSQRDHLQVQSLPADLEPCRAPHVVSQADQVKGKEVGHPQNLVQRHLLCSRDPRACQ